MRLYLDDDSVDTLFIRLLRQAGHDVETPMEAGLSGVHDAVHLTHAVRRNRVCLSKNHRDFRELDNLVAAAQGHHPGILVVRRDQDSRDMTSRAIVVAIGRIETAGLALADSLVVVNHWR